MFCKWWMLWRDKPNKMSVHPAKTQISLGIGPVWSVFAVRMKKAWVFSNPLSASENSDQTRQMPRLIWVFAGCICHFVGFVMRRLKWWMLWFLLTQHMGGYCLVCSRLSCSWHLLDLWFVLIKVFNILNSRFLKWECTLTVIVPDKE